MVRPSRTCNARGSSGGPPCGSGAAVTGRRGCYWAAKLHAIAALFSAALLALLYLSISDPSIRSASERLHSWGNMFLSSEKTRSAPAELGVMANCTGRGRGGGWSWWEHREDAEAEVEAATRARARARARAWARTMMRAAFDHVGNLCALLRQNLSTEFVKVCMSDESMITRRRTP